jgi:hypothetical protein
MAQLSAEELAELIPPSDAAKALRRMPKAERLPKYKANSLVVSIDIPTSLKDMIREAGLPAAE